MSTFSAVTVAKNGTIHKSALIAVARSVSSARGDEDLYTKVLNLLETFWARRVARLAREHKHTNYVFSRKTLSEEVGNSLLVIDQKMGLGVTGEMIVAIKALKC